MPQKVTFGPTKCDIIKDVKLFMSRFNIASALEFGTNGMGKQ